MGFSSRLNTFFRLELFRRTATLLFMSLLLHNTTRAINSERQMHCTDNLALRQAAHVVNFLHSSVLFADSYLKKKKKRNFLCKWSLVHLFNYPWNIILVNGRLYLSFITFVIWILFSFLQILWPFELLVKGPHYSHFQLRIIILWLH